MDVIFNALLIFPTRTVSLLGFSFICPGANLGVVGAQLGTSLAFLVSMIIMMVRAIVYEDALKIFTIRGNWKLDKAIGKEALRIGLPMALEQSATCGAQIVSTKIVAPLGTAAIAANSFAVTAESICYMPGYGIGSASTTMVGQAIGAKKKDFAKSFAWLTTLTGMAVMTVTGFGMFFLCPYVLQFLTPVEEVQILAIHALRIELFAEPLFAASIVSNGALRGAGDTFIPGMINLCSIWFIRLPIAYFLCSRIWFKWWYG